MSDDGAGRPGSAVLRLGVDVGGTKCLGVLLGDDGQVHAETRRPTPTHFADLADTVADVVTELQAVAGDTSPSVGVGLPGLVDRDGKLHAAPHLDDPLDLEPIDAGAIIGEQLGRPIEIDNDATCATRAEWQLGAGQGLSNFVLVTLGTGIGGGVVCDGSVLRGEHGFAGEIGHFQVDPHGLACSCGKIGCWETVASGRALGTLAQRGGFESGEAVEQAMREGDSGATAIIAEFGRAVAIGLSTLTNIFDPAAFVLGGGLAAAHDVLGEPLATGLAEQLYSSARRPRPELRFAELGPRAGAIGAALLGT